MRWATSGSGTTMATTASGAEGAHRGEAVVAVGRPVVAVVGADDHHRVEIAAEAVDGGAELGDMGIGEVALVGRGLDQIDGQSGEDLPVAAERIAIVARAVPPSASIASASRVTAGGGAPELRASGATPRERGAPSGRFFRRGFLRAFVSAI